MALMVYNDEINDLNIVKLATTVFLVYNVSAIVGSPNIRSAT